MKFLLLISLFLVSCGNKASQDELKKRKDIASSNQIIVGRIASVSRRGKFVLIQKLGTGTLPKGVIYQSRGPDGRTASLRLSGERIRDFFAADLLSGKTEKGNAVIAYRYPRGRQTTEENKIQPEDETNGVTKENLDEDGLPADDQVPQTIRD
tara:strand:- start:4491 stop:4949 length:459 start_codon:yes stop_codon:yes gene_type:complete